MLRSRLFGRSAVAAPEFPLELAEFAVLDFETTGLFPRGHDRVIEVGIVCTDADGNVTDEYETLVNPLRDLGPTAIHGLRAHELREAPQFAEIAGDVASRLDGSVVVAHNIRFERSFLDYELARCGLGVPTYPSLCTLALAARYGLRARRLGDCCAQLGIPHERAHTALDDARATAALLAHLLALAREGGASSLRAFECQPLPPAAWAIVAPSQRACPRSRTPVVRTAEPYVATLVRRLPERAEAPSSEAAVAYLDILDRALEDRVVTGAEQAQLAALAEEWGIAGRELEEIHLDYLKGLASVALADHRLTEAEETDLRDVAELLGLSDRLGQLLSLHEAASSRVVLPERGEELRGKSVCFTGQLLGTIDGQPLTRERAQALASAAGLDPRPSVTKALDLLVVADPDSMSAKARKAHEYGTRIIAERAFWKAIRAPVD